MLNFIVRIDKTCFNRNIFKIFQKKTGNLARVDIDKHAIDRNTTYALLEKYDFNAPYISEAATFDRYLHELLHCIGEEFDEEIKSETKINGVVETKRIPKWKAIASHTARRTFITTNILRGMSDAEVRRASGHKTASAMDKYLCYDD